MIIKQRKLIGNFLLILILLIYFIIISNSLNVTQRLTFIEVVQFIIIAIISMMAIISDKNKYSLNKMHWYFMLIFMVLAPFCQYCTGYYAWNYKVSNEYIEKANWVILLWIVIYLLEYNNNNIISIKKKKKREICLCNTEQNILIIISLISTMIIIALVGFNNLFLREKSFLSGGTFSIMFNYLFRSIPAINAAMFIKARKSGQNVPLYYIIILLLCTFIINSPLALSRYWVGVIYIGLALCIFPEKVFDGKKFDYYVLVGLLIMFPISYLFKKYTLFDVLSTGVKLDVIGVFLGVDFDAHSILCRIIQFVEKNSLQLGGQIKSVIFFFVPRAILDIKGIPTGQLVATKQGSYYTNVSAPLMGEGYIDFGIIGVILYAAIFAYVLKKIDKAYWDNEKIQKVYYMDIILPFMMGFVLFLMRGALQPAFLRFMGFFLYLIIYAISKKVRIRR